MKEVKERISILIKGRVQGVFFRRGAKTEANKLGLLGEARNLDDGSVQLIAEGQRKNLEKFLNWCWEGSRMAKVQSLEFAWGLAREEFNKFSIIREGNYLKDKFLALRNLSPFSSKKAVSFPGKPSPDATSSSQERKGSAFQEKIKIYSGFPEISAENIPVHVAIIPDGNRRWARARGLSTLRGHEKGLNNFTDLLEEASRLKIKYLTVWGFSTENWKRSKMEVNYLMKLFKRTIDNFTEKFLKNQIHFRHFGRRDRLPGEILKRISDLEETTKNFQENHFGLALDYGGRDEILRAIEKCKTQNGKVKEKDFSAALDTHGFPDPDLIIRTSGEMRTSGFLPWQGTYSELYFAPEMFPDFGAAQFRAAVADFQNRKRNFGT